MLVRLRCKEGCLRVNVQDNGTIADLLEGGNSELRKRKSKEKGQAIAQDVKYESIYNPQQTLQEAGVKKGDLLYLKLESEENRPNEMKRGEGAMASAVCANHGPNASCVQCMINSRINVHRVKETTVKSFQMDLTAGTKFQNFVLNEIIFEVDRVGILYGEVTTSEDKHEVTVHYIYEPPQNGEPNSFELKEGWKDELEVVDSLATAMGLVRVGVVVSHAGVMHNISTKELLLLGELYQPKSSKVFMFVVLAILESGEPGMVVFEVTKRFFELFWEQEKGFFCVSSKPAFTKTIKEIYVDKTYTTTIDNDYFILPVAIQPYASFLACEFGIENREGWGGRKEGSMGKDDRMMEMRALFEKYRDVPLSIPLSDFHLLLFLAQVMDVGSVCDIAQRVRLNVPLGEGYELVLRSFAGLN